MSFDIWQKEISQNIESTLNTLLPNHQFKEVISYSVLPAGKLFRPLLVYSLAQDLEEINEDHKHLAASLELHHTYTLIHDDLPAMDDDDTRRGRASSHIKFNEWSAILAGDALINLSYEVLTFINDKKLKDILKLYSSYMGASGLILGQVKDLGAENQTLEDILKIHELKTARLIQLALMGANLLSKKQLPLEECKNFGLFLGIQFQLLDDLCELTEPLNEHEKEINPFLHFNMDELFQVINHNHTQMKEFLNTHQLNHLKEYINLYLRKISQKLKNGHSELSQNLGQIDLKDVLELTL